MSSSRPSRAGSRDNRYRPGYGRMSDNKLALLRTGPTDLIMLMGMSPEQYDEENDITMSSEPGTSYIIMIPTKSRRPIFWNLSAMTEAELEATRQFFNHAFDQAAPVVRERDKVAADAFADGDDSYGRVYRPVPQFITRQGKSGQDSPRILDGSEDASPTTGD